MVWVRTLLLFSALSCATEDMRGVSGPGFTFCCYASVECIVANFRCNLSTYAEGMHLQANSQQQIVDQVTAGATSQC